MPREFGEHKVLTSGERIADLPEKELIATKLAVCALFHIGCEHGLRESLPDLLEYGDNSAILDTQAALVGFGYVKEGDEGHLCLTEKAEPIFKELVDLQIVGR
jgi:hypothetical protein